MVLFLSQVSLGCGAVNGIFTAAAPNLISFDLEAAAITCMDGEHVVEFPGLLETADTWRFENGGLVIMLGDGTDLDFRTAE